jgi:signal transduction histidine kinase
METIAEISRSSAERPAGGAFVHPAAPLLDTPPEADFDALTKLATKALGVPASLVSLVEPHRQFFKSQCGLREPFASERETPISHSVCQHVVASGQPIIIEDARLHPLLRDNLAIPTLGMVAYLGVPLFDSAGVAYGAFCAFSGEPRRWTAADLEILTALAAHAMRQIDLRIQVARQNRDLASLRRSEEIRASVAQAERHDLRTPLNALLLGLRGIQLLGELNEDQAVAMAIVERNGRVLAEMIDEMLDIGSIDARGELALARRPALPLELLGRAIEQVTPLVTERQQTLSNSGQTLRAITADGEKIVRVLVNILGNAIKFTPPGGCINVAVFEEVDEGRAWVVFSVRDTGIGISEADLQRIFAQGFRADETAPTRRSAGIGLTFCKRVVEAHGGRIWVTSKLGEGSTFSVSLPTEFAQQSLR